MLYYKTFIQSPHHEWVVLIHGAGGSTSVWFRQIREYARHFNVLLVDLRGHGKSQHIFKESAYSFRDVTYDIIEVMDYCRIESAHFVGVSLGTILIRTLDEIDPDRIKSMVMVGAVTRLNFRSRFLMRIADLIKKIIPFIWIFKIYAHIVMPTKRNRESRNLFIREGRRIANREFLRWLRLTTEVNPLLRYFREKEIYKPTLYAMGEDDYMFLPQVKNIISKDANSILRIFRGTGHVVNVEQPQDFNRVSIEFIKSVACGAFFENEKMTYV